MIHNIVGLKAGYGVYWGSGHADNTCGPVHGAATNNRGELLAVDVALKQVNFENIQTLPYIAFKCCAGHSHVNLFARRIFSV